MINRTIFLTAISAIALIAQTPQVVEEKQIHIIGGPGGSGPGAGAFAFVSAEASFEATLVKGIPFTGDFVTENSQFLADGNRIKSSNTSSFARDGEGRTWREVTLDSIGPFAGSASRKTIFINDPVSKIDYILDPQAKTARKFNIGDMIAKMPTGAKDGQNVFFTRRIEGPAGDGAKAPTVTFERRIEGGKDVLVTNSGPGPVEMQRMPLPPGIVMQGQAGAVISHHAQMAAATHPRIAGANVKSDPLGKRVIEGVEAEGTRSTITIPAGQIGNERPLDTVSERWYSNELKTVVLTTRKDPRTGESNYKLTNLRRGEPSRQLFEVPSDYKIITEDNVGPNSIRMRVEHKE